MNNMFGQSPEAIVADHVYPLFPLTGLCLSPAVRPIAAGLFSVLLASCSSGGSGGGSSPSTYTVGGTVSGLSGSGLVLRDNGGDDLPVSANGAFVFATPLADGATFSVSVSAQPSVAAQNCVVMNAGHSGTVLGAG